MTDLFQTHLRRHIHLAQTIAATLEPVITHAAATDFAPNPPPHD